MIPRWTVLIALGVAVAGCNMWQNRAEFDPPSDRWPGTQWPQAILPDDFPLGQHSSPIAATAPPLPIPVVFCYRTLAIIDCYSHLQPERYYGYTGTYPD